MAVEPSEGRTDVKRAILQAVYEDNQRIAQNARLRSAPRKRRVLPYSRLQRPQVYGVLLALLVGLISVHHVFLPQDMSGRMGWRTQTDEPPAVGVERAAETLPVTTHSAGALAIADVFGLKIKTIVIDPGHGGRDPGAIGQGGTKEKDITLDVARHLKTRLEKYSGYRILLTREEDVLVSLQGRVALASSHKADLFISIHVNYLPVEPQMAIETYYFGLQSGQQMLALVERENRESEYGMGDFKDMLEKAGNTMKLQESKALAMSVQKSLYSNVRQQNRSVNDSGVKSAPFVVLLEASMPSILVEIACLNNRQEETKLSTGAYREKLAAYLEEGVVRYLHERSRNPQPEGGVTSHVARQGERSK